MTLYLILAILSWDLGRGCAAVVLSNRPWVVPYQCVVCQVFLEAAPSSSESDAGVCMYVYLGGCNVHSLMWHYKSGHCVRREGGVWHCNNVERERERAHVKISVGEIRMMESVWGGGRAG